MARLWSAPKTGNYDAMSDRIVHVLAPVVESAAPITLIGGGQVTHDDLHKALTLAPICVAADGGAAHALAAGVMPHAVIGDMDSLDAASSARLSKDKLHRVTEQDSTDFDKALRRIAAPIVIGVGFCGGRIDHQLAAFHTLLARADTPCVLLAGPELVFLAPPRITLPAQDGDVVSLFPLVRLRGRSTGLKWEIDEVRFDPATQIGTSNQATGPVTLEIDAPGMLVIVKSGLIQPVVEALSAPHARWPVRAAQ